MIRRQHGFADRVSALWADLGLGEPVFDRDGSTRLEVERRTVRFAESADGQSLVITASPGSLSTDERRRAEEVRRLLRRSLGMLTQSRTGLALGDGQVAKPIVVRAAIALDRAEPAMLTTLVEDLIARANEYATDLDRSARAPVKERAPSTSLSVPETESILIFRP